MCVGRTRHTLLQMPAMGKREASPFFSHESSMHKVSQAAFYVGFLKKKKNPSAYYSSGGGRKNADERRPDLRDLGNLRGRRQTSSIA